MVLDGSAENFLVFWKMKKKETRFSLNLKMANN